MRVIRVQPGERPVTSTVVGSFSSAGGVPANRVAKWDGSSWSALGTGTSLSVRALAVFDDGAGAELVVGGQFTSAGGTSASYIAKWDGSAWSPLGSGMQGPFGLTQVTNLVVFDDGTGSALYAGGIFTSAGGVGVGHIARWNEFFVAYGSGCPGSGGVIPVLSGVGWPGPGSNAGVALTGGQPFGTGVLVLATSPGSTPVLGCTLFLGGLLFGPVGVALDASGAFSLTWPLALSVATGAQVFFQYAGADPGAPNGMFSASNGLKVTLQ